MAWNYYNDIDEEVCEWLRELIRAGLIPDGEVDQRSILNVEATDLMGFNQCHFFAGIGGWAEAFRIAGLANAPGIWTGSPPCQPFSIAGDGDGADDERHLAPQFAKLVGQARPRLLFGEQVASAAVFGKIAKANKRDSGTPPKWAWCDDLSDRLEAAHYATGALDIPSAGIGSPNIRQRTFFFAVDGRVSDSSIFGRDTGRGDRSALSGSEQVQRFDRLCSSGGLADDDSGGFDQAGRSFPARWNDGSKRNGPIGRVVNSVGAGLEGYGGDGDDRDQSGRIDKESDGSARAAGPACGMGHNSGASPLHGFWANADWLFCRDGKWRPVEPGTFPLASRVSGRMGLLRGYGNAINPWAAAEAVKIFIEAIEG